MPRFKEFPMPMGVRTVDGEPLRFHVRSRSTKEWWQVDLEECGFNGACGCPDFQIRQLKLLRDDRRDKKPRRKHRCWHIRKAMYFHAELTARQIAQGLYEYYKPVVIHGARPPALPPAQERD